MYGKKATDQVDAWATITKRALERVDDSFQSMWESVISGTGDAMDNLKSLVTSTLAELAHQLLTKPLVLSIGAALGVTETGTAAAGTTGGGGSSSLFNLSGLLSGTNIGSGLAGTLFDLGSFAGIAPDTLASGLGGLASTPNWALGIGGIGGGILGNLLFGDTQAGSLGSSFGSAAGAAIGSAILPGIGTILGGLLGGTGGGFLGSLFGGAPKIPEVTVSARGGGVVPVSGYNLSSEQYQQAIQTIDAANQFINDLVFSFGPSGQAAVANVNIGATKSGPGDLAQEVLNLLKTDLQAAASADDPLAKFVQSWVGDLSGSLEDAATKIQEAVVQFRGLQQIISNFGQLGVSLGATDDAAIAAAQHLATLAGGVDQLANAQAFYYQNILSETDRLRIQFGDVEEKIVSFNDALGLTGDAAIDTRKELKDYVDSLDLQTEAGRQAYVQALQLAPSITTLGQIFTQLGGDASAASIDLASFIQELDKISASVADMFQSTFNSIEVWGLSSEEIYRRTKQQADQLVSTIDSISDPDKASGRWPAD